MWWSLNIKVDEDLMWDISEHVMKIFEPLLETIPGIERDVVAQPISYVSRSSHSLRFEFLTSFGSVRMIKRSREIHLMLLSRLTIVLY